MANKILETILAGISIIGFFGGFAVWLGAGITGNVIGPKPTDWIGGIMILIGTIATFFWTISKGKKSKVSKARTVSRRKPKKVAKKKKR